MKNYLLVLLTFCLSLHTIEAQKNDIQVKGEFLQLAHTPVTLLMKDRSALQGLIKMDYVYTLDFETKDGVQVIKKKKIMAVIPGNAVFVDLEDRVLAKDIIILKNKIWLLGEIAEIGPQSVRFSMENSMFELSLSQVTKIYPKGLDVSSLSISIDDEVFIKPVKPVKLEKLKRQFLKNGIYHILYANIASQNEIFEESPLSDYSTGFQYIVGFQITQLFGAGLGAGYLDYGNLALENRPRIIPIFVDARGYLSNKKTSVYYNLAIGLTTATIFNKEIVNNIRPGIFTHPAIGYKIGSEKFAFLIDLGIQLSQVEYELALPNVGLSGPAGIENYETGRVVLRLGLMF